MAATKISPTVTSIARVLQRYTDVMWHLGVSIGTLNAGREEDARRGVCLFVHVVGVVDKQSEDPRLKTTARRT